MFLLLGTLDPGVSEKSVMQSLGMNRLLNANLTTKAKATTTPPADTPTMNDALFEIFFIIESLKCLNRKR